MNDQPTTPGGPGGPGETSPPRFSGSIKTAAERIQVIIEAAERAAAGIIEDAEAQARIYAAESRRYADQEAAGRSRTMFELTDSLITRAQAVKAQSDELIAALDSARAQLHADSAPQPAPAPPPAPDPPTILPDPPPIEPLRSVPPLEAVDPAPAPWAPPEPAGDPLPPDPMPADPGQYGQGVSPPETAQEQPAGVEPLTPVPPAEEAYDPLPPPEAAPPSFPAQPPVAQDPPASFDDQPFRPSPLREDGSLEPVGTPATGADGAAEPSAGAHLLAAQMAVAGSSREEIASRLRDEFGIYDAGPMLDSILGPGQY